MKADCGQGLQCEKKQQQKRKITYLHAACGVSSNCPEVTSTCSWQGGYSILAEKTSVNMVFFEGDT